MKKEHYIVLVIPTVISFCLIIFSQLLSYQRYKSLIDREMHGVFIKVDSLGKKAYYDLYFKENKMILKYTFVIGNFLHQNNIQKNDSVSKSANSNELIFYKKDGWKWKENAVYIIGE